MCITIILINPYNYYEFKNKPRPHPQQIRTQMSWKACNPLSTLETSCHISHAAELQQSLPEGSRIFSPHTLKHCKEDHQSCLFTALQEIGWAPPTPRFPPEGHFQFLIFESYRPFFPHLKINLAGSHESGSAYCTYNDLIYVVSKRPFRRKPVCSLLEVGEKTL